MFSKCAKYEPVQQSKSAVTFERMMGRICGFNLRDQRALIIQEVMSYICGTTGNNVNKVVDCAFG